MRIKSENVFWTKKTRFNSFFTQGFRIKISGAAHRNICRKIGNIKVEGAAHRNIKFNISVRCTFYKKTLLA
jgi:hypothetical protein